MNLKSENNARSLERKLNALMLKLSELERRLKKLEERVFPQRPTRVPKARPHEEKIPHTYLTRAITSAKREYERKSG